MKIVIINGSARRGNTLTAIDAFIKGASEKNEIEIIQPDRLHIAPCKGYRSKAVLTRRATGLILTIII